MTLAQSYSPIPRLALIAMLALIGASALGERGTAQTGPQSRTLEFNIPDVLGRTHTGREIQKSKAAAFFFIATECPISNRYAPEIGRIVADYAKLGFVFYGVHSDPDIYREVARKHAVEYGYQFPILLDPGQTLAAKLGVTLTPTVVVVSPAGQIMYRGRIDNRYIDFGVFRNAGITPDLRNALDAIREERPVAVPITKSIGCAIPTARKESHSGAATTQPE